MRAALRNNGISVFLLALFLAALVAQSVVGLQE
jgi:hypothetical protein